MRVDNSAGKGTSGLDKFGSVIDRMNMKLGFLKIKTQLLKRLQRCIYDIFCRDSVKYSIIYVYCIHRVGQNHIFIRIKEYGVHTVFSAGKLPYIRSRVV